MVITYLQRENRNIFVDNTKILHTDNDIKKSKKS